MNHLKGLCLYSVVAIASLYASLSLAESEQGCRLQGRYGYLYNGTSYPTTGAVPLTETGFFAIDQSGQLNGVGTLAFQFANFGGSPLWLLLREVQSDGVVSPDPTNPCTGTFNFVATATVLKTSNPALVPVGTVLFTNAPRSIAYTISGRNNDVVDLISTSPGTIASGVAHKQSRQNDD